MVTNRMHLSHHSANPREFGTNLGGLFRIWDRLFGTYLVPDPGQRETRRYGLAEVPARNCAALTDMLLLPLRRANH